MKVTRKQIGVKMKIDHETGYPILEPIYETKIQPPMWKVVLKKTWSTWVCTFLCALMFASAIKDKDYLSCAFQGFLTGMQVFGLIVFTYRTIKENS